MLLKEFCYIVISGYCDDRAFVKVDNVGGEFVSSLHHGKQLVQVPQTLTEW